MHRPIRYRNQAEQPTSREFPIGFDKLMEYLNKDPSMIARGLLNPKSGYEILIRSDAIPPKKMDILLKVLEKTLESRTGNISTICL